MYITTCKFLCTISSLHTSLENWYSSFQLNSAPNNGIGKEKELFVCPIGPFVLETKGMGISSSLSLVSLWPRYFNV